MRRISIKIDEKKINETGDVIVEMNQAYDDDPLEERLERVYFSLVMINAKIRNKIDNLRL